MPQLPAPETARPLPICLAFRKPSGRARSATAQEIRRTKHILPGSGTMSAARKEPPRKGQNRERGATRWDLARRGRKSDGRHLIGVPAALTGTMRPLVISASGGSRTSAISSHRRSRGLASHYRKVLGARENDADSIYLNPSPGRRRGTSDDSWYGATICVRKCVNQAEKL